SVRIAAVAHGKKNHISLVALDVLQVLDEERLLTIGREELLEALILAPKRLETIEDRGLLRLAERADAKRSIRVAAEMLEDGLRDAIGFDLVRPSPRAIEDAVGDVHEVDAQIRASLGAARERMKPLLVEVMVREGDERFVAASVMPAKHLARESLHHALVEDALEIGRLVLVVGIERNIRALLALEEGGRRELAAVSDDDHLRAARDGPDRILGRDLARLVEDHDVELDRARIEELSHRERAHEEAGLETKERVRDLLEELADRLVPALAANLSLEDPQLRARRRLPGGVRERIEEPLAQAPSREPELGEVELAEVADRLLVILAPESLEGGARLEDRVEPKPEEEPLERGRELVVGALHFACARKEAREPDL